MSFTATGRIVAALPETSGTSAKGNAWRKREYVLETQEQYPKKICFSVMNDRIDALNLAVGDTATIDFSIESREYQGRWYTSVNLFNAKVDKAAQTAQPLPPNVMSTPSSDGMPF